MNLGNVIESKVNSLPNNMQIEVLNFVETLIRPLAKLSFDSLEFKVVDA